MKRFGDVLKECRENRGLSLRELRKLSKIDHAYIHRLETGTKVTPSDKVFNALVRALKVTPRQRDLLNTLRTINSVSSSLFDAMLSNETRSILAFETAAKMSFRGERPSTVEKWDELLGDLDARFFQQ